MRDTITTSESVCSFYFPTTAEAKNQHAKTNAITQYAAPLAVCAKRGASRKTIAIAVTNQKGIARTFTMVASL